MDRKHIISFSGGKNSTAMLLHMIELKMPIDEIRYFDAGSWDFPETRTHIDKVEKYIGLKINRLEYKHTLNYYFSKVVKKKGEYKGEKGYGFPSVHQRWCTRIKGKVLAEGVTKDNAILYIGFSIDEITRTRRKIQLRFTGKFPLIEWGWSDEDCLNYCYEKGFHWDGLYQHRTRSSCWCCPLQNIKDLRNLRKYYPDLWQKLLEMQKKTKLSFYADGRTVFDFDKRFKVEESQSTLFKPPYKPISRNTR